METLSPLLAICAGNSPVTDEFPVQRPVTRSFDVFFDLRMNERLRKQSWRLWFETPSRPLWRYSNATPTSVGTPAPSILTDPLQWRHNGHDSVSNHQPHDCLLNRLFRRRSKKTSKLRVTGLCAGNSPGTGEFPTRMASNAENVSIWWRRHAECTCAPSQNKTRPSRYRNSYDKDTKSIWSWDHLIFIMIFSILIRRESLHQHGFQVLHN